MFCSSLSNTIIPDSHRRCKDGGATISSVVIVIAAVVVGVDTDEDDISFGKFITPGKAWYSIGKRDAYRGSKRGRDGDGTIMTFFIGVVIRFVDVVANCGVDTVEEE
jgi:hypothetical protein